MIDIINDTSNTGCFKNSVWVSFNEEGVAHRVFESEPDSIKTHKVSFRAKNGLPEKVLFKLMNLDIPFSDVNMCSEFMLHEKSRLFRIQRELTQYLSRT